MNETQQRIKAYKDALPGLKERVAAVALLLVMSMAMLTSASFAWITLSRAPELSGVSTNIAANGNLEIALATGDGKTPPGESKVGDSSAAEGQSVVGANVTWGNLINLSDPGYGLDHLALRPAQLNTAALLTKPLYGAVYNDDGRIKTLTSDYGYTAWIPAEGNVDAHFGVSSDVGVRAISSIKREQVGFAGDYKDAYDAADIANQMAANTYTGITKKQEWLDVLAKLLGIHMTASLNGEDQYKNATIEPADMEALIAMYEEFVNAHSLEADAIAKQLNLELFTAYGGNTENYTPFTKEDVLAINPNGGGRIQANGDYSFDVTINKPDGSFETKTIKITNLKAFLKDYNQLTTDLATLNQIHEAKDYRWTASGLYKVVERLMDVNKCLIRKQGESSFKTVEQLMKDFSSSYTTALGYMNSSCDIVITNGVLYNLEQRVGSSINIQKMTVTAKMYVSSLGKEFSADVIAYVTTSATEPYHFQKDLTYTDKTLNTGADTSSGEAVAEDTYALAVDFWVRTNATNSYLTLEGNVLLGDPYEVPVTTLDANGNEVPLYTLTQTFTDEETKETITETLDVYKKESGGTVTWYVATSHRALTAEELGGVEPVPQVEEKRDVIGYEGENRVWDKTDKDYLTADSTTQGVGSCYVYYADSPEDQARSLELLKSLTVAFVDGEGALLATASMDTENYYGSSGRFVVPLKVNDDGIQIKEMDEAGEEVIRYGITALQQNQPTRITAIVYLDGRELGNEDVLSAADIQGQLNIQFGNSKEMEPIDNEQLEYETRRVSASVDNTSFEYDTHVGDMISTVTVHVDGAEPTNVKAFFQRKINATQGSREKEMTFIQNDSGDWTASYTFTAPGEYILRSVYLDGMEYVLETPATVTITGFTIASLNCDQITEGRHINIMTAANSSTLGLKLKFATDDASKMPSTVQGRFLRNEDGSAVNVEFTYNATAQIWSGSATFLNSGEYTLQYLVLNGEYVELAESQWITASIKLGMKVAIYTTDITTFKFKPDEMTENGTDQLQMQVKIMDNGNKPLVGLQNVKLTYRLKNSSSTMDVDLTWNASSQYYVGDLQALLAGPGIWEFYRVTIGEGNTITNATTYPVFEMQSPEPPSFVSVPQATSQYSSDGKATMKATLKYSGTATVAAVFKDAAGNRYPVLADPNLATTDADNNTTWNFAVPTNKSGEYSGKQDGYWTLETVYLWNYYMADGEYVEWKKDESGNLKGELSVNADGSLVSNPDRDDENVMVIDVKSSNNGKDYTNKVVQTITVTFAQNQSKVFGKNGDEITGTFMQANTISGVTATIRDFTGAVEGIGDVTLTYAYGKDSLAKGGYSGGDATYEGFTLTLKQDATDKTKFVQDGTETVRVAGTYTLTGFKFAMAAGSYSTIPATAPSYEVWSKTPTVKITSAYYWSESSDSAASYTDTSTTVYIRKKSGTCNVTNYTPAKVTIKLSGYGSASDAKLEFTTTNSDGKVHLYQEGQQNNGTATNAYQWTAEGDCLRHVGYWKSKTGGDEKTAAGTLKASKLILTYGNYSYEVDIVDITISNPS